MYLRLAEYSLPAAPVTPLSSHTSHLFFETGRASLLHTSPSLLVPQTGGRRTFYYPSCVCTAGELFSADCVRCYLSFGQWTQQCIYPAKLKRSALLSKSSSLWPFYIGYLGKHNCQVRHQKEALWIPYLFPTPSFVVWKIPDKGVAFISSAFNSGNACPSILDSSSLPSLGSTRLSLLPDGWGAELSSSPCCSC